MTPTGQAKATKDYTYSLWGIDRSVLRRMLLPVGSLTKAETRAMAHKLGLEIIAERQESQEICFVPDGDDVRVLRSQLGPDASALSRGPIVLSDGRVVGEHTGYARFTIGQRRGLPGGFGMPMYVVAIEPATRSVVIGPREELLGSGVVAREVNWLVDLPPRVGDVVHVRVRHRAPLVGGELIHVEGDESEIALDEPVAAITPGQSLVLYDEGQRLLGGGFIDLSRRDRPMLPVLAA